MRERIVRYLRLFRVADAAFDVPALLASVQLAGAWWPGFGKVGLIALALGLGGAAGLLLNRWVDRRIDARNPRTADRAMATGEIRSVEAAGLVALTLVPCVGLIAWLSPQLLHLTPIFLVLLIGYPFLKRWTWACNFFVGVQLTIIPLWVWLVFNDAFPSPAVLAFAGFILAYRIGTEVIYAHDDVASDRAEGIHSVPADLGEARAWQITVVSFIVSLVALVTCVWLIGLTPVSIAMLTTLAAMLALQLWLARAGRFADASLAVTIVVSPLAFVAVFAAGGS